MNDQIEPAELSLKEIGFGENNIGHHRRLVKLCGDTYNEWDLFEGLDKDLCITDRTNGVAPQIRKASMGKVR
jgi:hypothetical protein